ncbi:MAG: hypothetical protein AAFX99_23640, partial [Myxococcota bacterium]
RRLPVVRGDLLVGQVSRRDLLRAMHGLSQGTASGRFKAIPLYLSALRQSGPHDALRRSGSHKALAPPSRPGRKK